MRPPPDRSPRCRSCGYALSGLAVDGKCPECGRPIWKPGSFENEDICLWIGAGSLLCLGVFVFAAPILGGVAIYFGLRDRRRSGFKGKRLAGMVMGMFAILFGLALTLAIVLFYAHWLSLWRSMGGGGV